jgi:predicted acylesterase/phospholipase RssA
VAKLPIQFVFQGGGAKLGALMAAAEAVYNQRGPIGYEITMVSGTSAGAIVACMLASGMPMSTFRNHLANIASKYVDKIVRRHSRFRLGYCLWYGIPLYDVEEYRTFITDLFKLPYEKPFVYLSDLAYPCDVLIHAVDIRRREPRVYRKSSDGKVEIADARWIPLHCHTFFALTGSELVF